MASNRYNGNVVPFAANATGLNRTVFGDTNLSDDIDDNLNNDYKLGWEIVGINDSPTKQDFNALGFTQGKLISHLYQQGLSEYNVAQEYYVNSLVMGSNGVVYQSLSGTEGSPNVGNNPITDDTNWKLQSGTGAYVIDTVDDFGTVPSGIDTVIVKDINRGGTFVYKTAIEIDPNTGSLYEVNGGTVFAKLGGGFWVRQYSGTVYVQWFGNDTIAIQNAINTNPAVIEFKRGSTYVLSCSESGFIAACILVKNKKNILFRGNGSLLTPSLVNVGEPNFQLFRIEGSTNIEFADFKIDGDYSNHPGDGESRSGAFCFSSFDRISKADEIPNKNITFRSIECNNIGSFIYGASVSTVISPSNSIINVINCYGVDAALANNTIGFRNVNMAYIYGNSFFNTIKADPYPSLGVDISSGCTNVIVENNIFENYVFGAKSESSSIHGYSDNVIFSNNKFINIGHPTLTVIGSGGNAGATYGLKLNSKICAARNNKITGISSNFLGSGILPRYTLNEDCDMEISENVVSENVKTCIAHSTIFNRGKYTISNNSLNDADITGITMGAYCFSNNNNITNCTRGVSIQTAVESHVLNNNFYNCGTNSIPVVYQEETGAAEGYFSIMNNNIYDARGESAATNGYLLNCNEAKKYDIKAGNTTGLLGSIFVGNYFGSTLNDGDLFFSILGKPSAGSFTQGKNIKYVEVVGSLYRIHFVRPKPNILLFNIVDANVANRQWQPWTSGSDYIDFRYIDSTTGVVQALPTNISISATIGKL